MPTHSPETTLTQNPGRGGRSHDSPARDPSIEQIADLAYRYWAERQKTHAPGSDVADWLRAEAELIRKREAALDEASEESFPASDPPAR